MRRGGVHTPLVAPHARPLERMVDECCLDLDGGLAPEVTYSESQALDISIVAKQVEAMSQVPRVLELGCQDTIYDVVELIREILPRVCPMRERTARGAERDAVQASGSEHTRAVSPARAETADGPQRQGP